MAQWDLEEEIQRLKIIDSVPFVLVEESLSEETWRRARKLEAKGRERESRGLTVELNLLSTVLKNPLPKGGWPMPQPKDEDSDDDYILAETEEEWKEWKEKKEQQRAERAAAKITTPRPVLRAARQILPPVMHVHNSKKHPVYDIERYQEGQNKGYAGMHETENGFGQSFRNTTWERDPSLRDAVFQAASPISQLALSNTGYSSFSQPVYGSNTHQPLLSRQASNSSTMNRAAPYEKRTYPQSQPQIRPQMRPRPKTTAANKSQEEMFFPSPSTTHFLYGSPVATTPHPTITEEELYVQEIQEEIESLDQDADFSEMITFGRQLPSPPRTSTTRGTWDLGETQDDGIIERAESMSRSMDVDIGDAYCYKQTPTLYRPDYPDPYAD